MAGFEAKAKAIWSALDDMAEKNPDMYKQFISDQLNGEGAQEMMKQLNLDADYAAGLVSSTNRKMPGSNSKQTAQPEKWASNYITAETGLVLTTSSKQMSMTIDTTNVGDQVSQAASTASSTKKSCQNSDSRTTTMLTSNSLLDDTFAQTNSNLLLNPFLAQIVAKDQDDEDLMTELKLPEEKGDSDSKKAKKAHKLLIEEI